MPKTSIAKEAVDRATGAAQKLAGTVTGQEDLQREGDLHKERADSSREARVESDRAQVAEELTEAQRKQREAASERDRLSAETQRERGLTEAERQAKTEEKAVADQTERAKKAVVADKQRAVQAAEREAKAAKRGQSDARRRGADLTTEATKQEKKAESFDALATPDDAKFTERLLSRGLTVTRLPLTAVERVTGHKGSNWPPAVAYTMLEASVMQMAGGVLRNDEMVHRGRSKQAAAHTLSDASTKQAEADRIVEEASQRTEAKLADTAKKKQKTQRSAQGRTAELERREKARQAQVDQKAHARKEAVQERARKAEEGARRRSRTDKLQGAAAQEKAASRRSTAARKEQKVVATDQEIANSRRTRKQHS